MLQYASKGCFIHLCISHWGSFPSESCLTLHCHAHFSRVPLIKDWAFTLCLKVKVWSRARIISLEYLNFKFINPVTFPQPHCTWRANNGQKTQALYNDCPFHHSGEKDCQPYNQRPKTLWKTWHKLGEKLCQRFYFNPVALSAWEAATPRVGKGRLFPLNWAHCYQYTARLAGHIVCLYG